MINWLLNLLSPSRALRHYIASRDAALENDNYSWLIAHGAPADDPDLLAIIFHKMRVEAVNVSEEKRQLSREWLINRGLSTFASPTQETFP